MLFMLCMSCALQAKAVTPVYKPISVSYHLADTGKAAIDSTTHHKRKHKLFAALLAFPIPFGVFGLHRAYLGTTTGVPLVYIASLGGCLGMLPFTDFVLILLNRDINAYYAHNPHLFMWSKKSKPATQP